MRARRNQIPERSLPTMVSAEGEGAPPRDYNRKRTFDARSGGKSEEEIKEGKEAASTAVKSKPCIG